MVKLNHILKDNGVTCEIVAKLEFMNPGGSIKDRVGRNLIENHIKNRTITERSLVVLPTTGNSGIGVSLQQKAHKFDLVVCMQESASTEKLDVLRAMGTTVLVGKRHTENSSGDSYKDIAERLVQDHPDAFHLDQYDDFSNPEAHYKTTGPEIWKACGGKIDMLVCCTGSCGTISGIGKYLKEQNPDIQIVGVDSHYSVLSQEEKFDSKKTPTKLEGVGKTFVPSVLDVSVVDKWVKIHDKDAFLTSREIIKKEGILCGATSGAALWAAMREAKDLDSSKRVVIIFTDGVRNSMSTLLNNDWMFMNGYISQDEILEGDQDSEEVDLEKVSVRLETGREDQELGASIE